MVFKNFTVKFFHKWIGRYQIEKVVHLDVYILDLLEKFGVHLIFHVFLSKKYLESN